MPESPFGHLVHHELDGWVGHQEEGGQHAGPELGHALLPRYLNQSIQEPGVLFRADLHLSPLRPDASALELDARVDHPNGGGDQDIDSAGHRGYKQVERRAGGQASPTDQQLEPRVGVEVDKVRAVQAYEHGADAIVETGPALLSNHLPYQGHQVDEVLPVVHLQTGTQDLQRVEETHGHDTACGTRYRMHQIYSGEEERL